LDPKVHLKLGHGSHPGSTLVTCAALIRRVIRRSMRFHGKGALLLLLLNLAPNSVVSAQEKPKRVRPDEAHRVIRDDADLQRTTIRSRLLTLNEGLEILATALNSRHHVDSSFDCSHFVHGLYERAGFTYGYASSSELYAGIDEFRRVASPQTGDLAVWRGHTGIVINPVQHSFFSLLNSGPGVDSYESPYWKQKGRPRFFRYVKVVPSGVLSSSIRTASLKPTVLRNTEPHDLADEDPEPDGSKESSTETGSSAKLAENQPVNRVTPRVPIVNAVRPKPDQVGAAFLQMCADSAQSLRGRDLFQSAQSVIVFDHFEVRKVHLTGKGDWVEVQIDELASLTGSKAEAHKRSERQRWPLSRRNDTSWELTPSRDTIYLPQSIAVRILAHELARLTEDISDATNGTQEKAELARLLDALLEK
jgi:hypothetical protein